MESNAFALFLQGERGERGKDGRPGEVVSFPLISALAAFAFLSYPQPHTNHHPHPRVYPKMQVFLFCKNVTLFVFFRVHVDLLERLDRQEHRYSDSNELCFVLSLH